MLHKGWTFKINDILSAILAIQKYTTGISFDEFVSDQKTIDAVIKNIIIIGEAANKIPEEVWQTHPNIPWQEMLGLRNFVVHQYFDVDNKIIWETIQKDLPTLVPLLNDLLVKYS